MSILSQLNELIEFYDKNNPRASRTIPVTATANTVRKFAKKRDGKYHYRDRIIVPTRPVRTRDEIAADREYARR